MSKQLNKICFIQFNLGSTSETFLTRHIELLKNNFEIYCVTGKVIKKSILKENFIFNFTEQSIFLKYKNKIKKYFGFTNFLYAESILKKLEIIEPDLIIFQFGFIPVLLEKELKKIKYPYIVIHHGTDVNRARKDKQYLNNLMKVWRFSSKVVFISKFLYNIGIELGCSKNKAILIPLGIPFDSESDLLNSGFIFDNEFIILSIARLVPVKNHKFLIKAFAIFTKQYPLSKLYIVGDGSEKFKLKDLIRKLDLEKKVILVGSLPFFKVKEYIKKSDVVCLVSKKVCVDGILQEEGLGLSLLEGASYKKPIIGTSTGGIPEIIQHKKTGLLINDNSTAELINSFEFLYNNPEKRKKMGEDAYFFVKENYNEVKQIQVFIGIYNKSINHN